MVRLVPGSKTINRGEQHLGNLFMKEPTRECPPSIGAPRLQHYGFLRERGCRARGQIPLSVYDEAVTRGEELRAFRDAGAGFFALQR